jgi:hypothetical protein
MLFFQIESYVSERYIVKIIGKIMLLNLTRTKYFSQYPLPKSQGWLCRPSRAIKKPSLSLVHINKLVKGVFNCNDKVASCPRKVGNRNKTIVLNKSLIYVAITEICN